MRPTDRHVYLKLMGSPAVSATQEAGVRAAKALPAALHADGAVDLTGGAFYFVFRNVGYATAMFHVRSADSADRQRSYTLEPDEELVDAWVVAVPSGNYDFSVHGPNEFFRRFKGNIADPLEAALQIRLRYDDDGSGIMLDLSNHAAVSSRFGILNAYTGKVTRAVIAAGGTVSKHWSLDRMWAWYDLSVTVDDHSRFVYQAAGHIEAGEDSMSERAIGELS